jgi:hypothetical protein
MALFVVAIFELCRLIAKLDLPLEIGEIDAWEEYIVRVHNPMCFFYCFDIRHLVW